MALTYGFFDSLNHDRVYNAEQFSSFLDGIVYDGVYEAVGNKFYVAAYSGMNLTVDTGRAWFDHTWILNMTKYVVTIPAADTIYNRIDAVVLEVNKTYRQAYIKVIKGTATANPARPAMTKTASVKQYPLAYVTVPKLATSISQSNITYMVNTQATPLCSALALAGIPSGGSVGQVLAKRSSESGAIGWYDYDKLPYDVWYLAEGLNEGHVLAAYGFKKASSETNALNNINHNTSYPLVKSASSVTWSNSGGFYIPAEQYLNNQTLFNLNARSVVFKFANVGSRSGSVFLHSQHMGEGTYQGVTLAINHQYATDAWYDRVLPYFGASIQRGYDSLPGYGYNSTVETQDGVLGATFNGVEIPQLYFNGTTLALERTTDKRYLDHEISSLPYPWDGKLIGGRAHAPGIDSYTSFYIQAAVFFNVAITAAQHNQIARQMNSAFA